MLEWLSDNAMVVSALASVLMALVWVIYAHIGIIGFIHHRRPRIIIDQTEDRTLNTKFVIVNLSEQPVYISCIMIAVIHDGEEKVRRISKYREVTDEDGYTDLQNVASQLQQGTLDSGSLFMLGDTDRLLDWMLHGDGWHEETPRHDRLRQTLDEIEAIEVRVLSAVGVEDRSVGSLRRFEIDHKDGDIRIRPASGETRHLTGWRARTALDEWSEFCIRH
jgi:flagellar motor switch/type III secretory pathway protein FliN